ncbi:MAG: HEAT repeat domain-containing protein [Deltaproteobacteria bacterium]
MALTGCEDENEPKTWVNKLSNDARRPGATGRLRLLFESAMATTRPPNNPRDPAIRRFLDVALVPLVTSFNAHTDETVSRREAIEIIAQSQDPRAIPALTGALTFRPGNPDSERIALRSVQSLQEMAGHADGIPEAQKPAVVQALVATIDRATANTGNPLQIRYHAIQTLGVMRATTAVDTLLRLLLRPLTDQDISTARGAAEALGRIGDARGVDALVYGLFLNIRGSNAFPHCQRALAQIGPTAAVPRLIVTLQDHNEQVNALIAQYRNVPNGPQIPEGLVSMTAANVLAAFAAPESTDALLAVLNNREGPDSTRGAAGEALAYIAISSPARRAAILQAISTVFGENQPDALPEGHAWTAMLMAPRLALIGDPSSIPLIMGALGNRAIQEATHATSRAELLSSLAAIARHNDVAAFTSQSTQIRTQLEHFITAANADAQEDIRREVQPVLAALDRLDRVIAVARDCADGDMACYQGKLADANADTVRKAAYMMAWTTPDAQQGAARAAILARVNHPDVGVRRSLMVALDMLSPHGCPECITRINQLIESEHGQESKILSHLDGQLLVVRLTARAGG